MGSNQILKLRSGFLIVILSVLKIISASFSIERWLRQGSSLFGMLYSLVIEPLIDKLRKNVMVYLFLKAVCLTCLVYADDLIVLVETSNMILKLKNNLV